MSGNPIVTFWGYFLHGAVSPRCAAVPTDGDASLSARSALKATSEVGTGGPATRVIEADVLPTSPGHGDACGGLGGLYNTIQYNTIYSHR